MSRTVKKWLLAGLSTAETPATIITAQGTAPALAGGTVGCVTTSDFLSPISFKKNKNIISFRQDGLKVFVRSFASFIHLCTGSPPYATP
jgi:hypothetical protein